MHMALALTQGTLYLNQSPNSLKNASMVITTLRLYNHNFTTRVGFEVVFFPSKKLNLVSISLNLVKIQNGQSRKDSN